MSDGRFHVLHMEAAERRDRKAALKGKPYDANPYGSDDPGRRLAWSQGHNNQRVQDICHREEQGWGG